MVTHCVVLERKNGDVVLIDSGFGTYDVENPQHLGASMALLRPDMKREQTAKYQLEALGLDAKRVTDIVLTHLHYDHAGGLADFPYARVHVYEAEYAVAERAHTLGLKGGGYKSVHWKGANMLLHKDMGETWLGLRGIRLDDALGGLPLYLVPLEGHTAGMCGVAYYWKDSWFLHAGDVYYHEAELETDGKAPLLLRWMQQLVGYDEALRLQSLAKLKGLLAEQPTLQVFCAHSPSELRRMQR